MRGLDDTDREILTLLLEDGRRPFSEIAEVVDLSGPAVSDRVDRLREIGVVRGFTVDLDRSLLAEGVSVLVDLAVEPGTSSSVRTGLASSEAVEHVFTTAEERVVFTATVPEGDVTGLLAGTIDFENVVDYEVDLLTTTDWHPSLEEAELATTCVECGNRVTSEGERVTLDGDTYHFCCENCQSVFVDRYEELSEGM